ncbi:hypothetical protein [Streptomyces sp. NPDC021622]|uniref:hypothetical protein n=1 Tax=Streptomyces sp. NPDC021622 TaxID=3155013 RepID=UPI0033C281D7
MQITKFLMTGAAAAAMAGASASGAFAAGPAPSASVGDVATGALAQAHDNLNVDHLAPDSATVEALNGSGKTALNGVGRGVGESRNALSNVANLAGKIDQEGKAALADK